MSDQNRILCTHVGSLARPARLLDFISAIDKRVPVQEDAFEGCLKSAVAEVVAQQAKSGVDIVSDGEFGKFRTWSAYESGSGASRSGTLPPRPAPARISARFPSSTPNIFTPRTCPSAARSLQSPR